MSTNSFFAKFLRFIGIVLMALTGGFTFLGGVGTFCAAVFPQKYESMAGLIPFQWLYILFMLGTIAITHGIAGVTIFLLPIILSAQGQMNPLFSLVGIGGALIGIGGLLLSFLKTGKPILSRDTIMRLFPILLLLTTACFVTGFKFG